MNPILMEIVIELAAFLETAPDDEVDPDTAVKQLEAIAAALQQLEPADQAEFVLFTQQRAGEADGSEAWEFYASFADRFGLGSR